MGRSSELLHLWISLFPRKPILAHLTPASDDITCLSCLIVGVSLNAMTGRLGVRCY